jgi:hypothetical protein
VDVQAPRVRKKYVMACALALLSTSCGTLALSGGPEVSEGTIRQKSGSEYCLTNQCIYVTNSYGPPAIDIYPTNAHGKAKPIERIKGSATGLIGPSMVAVDANHNVYAANVNGYYQASITVYPAGEYGNLAPTQTISGPDTDMGIPNGIAVDSAGNIYVTNWFAGTPCVGSITVYAAGSNGDASPIAQIKGKKTRLCAPWGAALDTNGNIYVTSGRQYASAVYVYAAGSTGNVAPLAQISGTHTRLYDSTAVALDAVGNIYVTSNSDGTLVKFRAGAHGNANPLQAIDGMRTKLQFPYGIAVDSSDEIYTLDTTPRGRILAFASDANGDVPPVRVVRGTTRFGFNPSDIAIR